MKGLDKFELSLKTVAEARQAWRKKLVAKEGELDALRVCGPFVGYDRNFNSHRYRLIMTNLRYKFVTCDAHLQVKESWPAQKFDPFPHAPRTRNVGFRMLKTNLLRPRSGSLSNRSGIPAQR
jgi:hypothetical protein